MFSLRRFRWCAVERAVLLVLLALALGVSAAGAEGRLDPRIFAGRAQGQKASFLVLLRDQADLSAAAAIRDRKERTRFVYETLHRHAERAQAALRRRLDEARAAYRPFFIVNMIEVEATRSLAGELAAREEVASVEGNRPAALARLSAPGVEIEAAAPAIAAELPNLEIIGAPSVWARGFTGQEVVVGAADTGFQWEHPALRDRYRGLEGGSVSHDYNWHDAVHDAGPENPCGSDAFEPCDDEGHGTGTAGIAVGSDGGDNRTGVAPGARLIGCRNMDRGVGTPARYAECFEFFLAPTDRSGANPRPDLAADVINNSWGCPPREGCTDPDILRAVVENTRAAGIFVVVSAGNTGSDCSTIAEAPAIYAASFSVGATTLADAVAAFSSRGPVTVDGSNRLKPDLVAPGVFIRAPAPPDLYVPLTGTSAAGPHVAGAVALLWSAAPELLGDTGETEDLLRRSARPLISAQTCGGLLAGAVPNAVFGWGRLDVGSAVAMASPVGRADPRVLDRPGAPRVVAPRD
jgi:subtilisin family serine protease